MLTAVLNFFWFLQDESILEVAMNLYLLFRICMVLVYGSCYWC